VVVGKIAYVNSSIKLALTANFAASAVALRLFKHSILGPFQFVNFPCAFTVVAGSLLGPIYGFAVGVLSFIVSDVILGLGFWTIVTSMLCGLIGAVSGLIWNGRMASKIEVLVTSYILYLLYDVLSSFLLYLPLMPPLEAFIMGVVGLFLPVMGGYLYAVGPVTEFSSALITSILVTKINGLGGRVDER